MHTVRLNILPSPFSGVGGVMLAKRPKGDICYNAVGPRTPGRPHGDSIHDTHGLCVLTTGGVKEHTNWTARRQVGRLVVHTDSEI